MSEKRFDFSLGACKIYDKEEERLLEDTEVCGLLNEQQATINLLLEELINAQQQGYVVDFLHKNERCNLTPKELEDE